MTRSKQLRRAAGAPTAAVGEERPLVSLVVPAYNEAAILEANLARLCEYMATLQNEYRWEIVIVNDGSRDDTGNIAEGFAHGRDNVRVYHHVRNFGLGQAFKFAFRHCRGDYIVTLDIDLSYAPEHIGRLLEKIRATQAKIVLASPYMEGGSLANVPWLRRVMSIWANRFLSLVAHGHLSTLTCMVRAYDGRFVRGMNLRGLGMDIMPEMIYKTLILRGVIDQIPAHLDWGPQLAAGPKRRSSMRVLRHIVSTVLSGFVFRPFAFFVAPGLLLLAFSIYVNAWMFVHFFERYFDPTFQVAVGGDRVSAALASAYNLYPHTFIVGLLSLMLAIQLIGLGIMALQSKGYFEEIFHLGSSIFRETRERQS
jgi:glycosyltransferase involved in cell wall biosynthesis